MRGLADISTFMSLQNHAHRAVMTANRAVPPVFNDLRDSLEKLIAELEKINAELDSYKRESERLGKEIRELEAAFEKEQDEGKRNSLEFRIDRLKEKRENIDLEMEVRSLAAEDMRENLNNLTGQQKEDATPSARGETRIRQPNADRQQTPPKPQPFRLPQPPKPQPPEPPQPPQDMRQPVGPRRAGTLTDSVRPLFKAIGDFVNAAKDFHSWYRMAHNFVTAYDNEQAASRSAPKTWAGVQQVNDIHTRISNFKDVYAKLKAYSALNQPIQNNPVIEWSKSSPLMGLITRMNAH